MGGASISCDNIFKTCSPGSRTRLVKCYRGAEDSSKNPIALHSTWQPPGSTLRSCGNLPVRPDPKDEVRCIGILREYKEVLEKPGR
ncbi:hypothetical protein GLAREA_02330 [Glarea lozoyensis ATCC 20868]|uniref:Uncharacterized protein n=1 Tax=Glarea lozoyensis (strain ATCC 20868 / MF5171) TaxID=1116229 RepID=S3CIU3_GLAL2|nr:uncharacterized protein GLAREA_02330 [Glarea lozoyensis ATCC 20868]EPE26417.1 hypothetical protein GLAREA_02330 [Glarea lozoyensis ATCC 20868]